MTSVLPSSSISEGTCVRNASSSSSEKRSSGKATCENSSVSAIRPTRSTCLTSWYLALTVSWSTSLVAAKTSLISLNT